MSLRGDTRIPLPTESELGYLAGIMDGEGYFSASPKTNCLGMRVAMIDRVVIDWLAEHFAGNVSRAGRTVVGNQVHTWTLQRQADLAYVLPRIIPRLVLKQGQAEAMLALVHHQQARPRWEIPTARAPKAERPRRRKALDAWGVRGLELRAAVAAARHVGVSAV